MELLLMNTTSYLSVKTQTVQYAVKTNLHSEEGLLLTTTTKLEKLEDCCVMRAIME